eukprot:TRINITY_DN6126_c0_g1_i2.p1 TRINITY_DN6126_c0_g1~~TRINITY_DN6126_c0_g1_i2.p1  ORF type:complete len:404 (-),score=63.71 TRINITY_DN6126_c0_g1_i2:95-1306(-)
MNAVSYGCRLTRRVRLHSWSATLCPATRRYVQSGVESQTSESASNLREELVIPRLEPEMEQQHSEDSQPSEEVNENQESVRAQPERAPRGFTHDNFKAKILVDQFRQKFFDLSQRMETEIKRQNYKRALQIYLDFMQEENYPQNDMILSHQLLRIAARTKDLWLAQKVFADMQQRDTPEWKNDPVAYSTLVALNFQHRRYAEIERLWKEILENNVSVTMNTLHNILHGFGKQAKWAKMTSVLNFMKENGMSIGAPTYSILIRELVTRDMTESVVTIVDQMQANGIRPHVDLFNSLMQIYGNIGKYDQMEAAYNSMIEMGITPNRYSFTIVIFVYLRSGRIDKGVEFFEKMKEQTEPLEVDYQDILKLVSRFDRRELKEQLKRELEQLKAKNRQNQQNYNFERE